MCARFLVCVLRTEHDVPLMSIASSPAEPAFTSLCCLVQVKNIGICVFNSNWIKTCFGKPALDALRQEAVICSGSTLGSYPAVKHYVRTMLTSMDTVKCWLKGIESDQGYQNYLFYNGHFNTAMGNATLFHQGTGIINTIGAMNGYR
jgi:hypothetical protein